jgi:hypothetical protein
VITLTAVTGNVVWEAMITDARLKEIEDLEDLEKTGLDEVSVIAAELLHLRAEIAAIACAAGGDRGSDERLSEYVARLRGLPRSVPFMDERGRRIGDAVVDGLQIVARVTYPEAAAVLRASAGPRGVSVGYRVEAVPSEPARPEVRTDLVGGPDHQPFRIYARGERRPFDLGGDEPVVFGALRWSPIDAAGNVTLTAEGLRDLCNYVYRDGWRFGNLHLPPSAQDAVDAGMRKPDGSR